LLASVEGRADTVRPRGLLCTAWFKAWRLFRVVYENCGGLNNGGVFYQNAYLPPSIRRGV
jgi:hypothetical protein